jgi:uncharacterized protein GlcG (DUF336 family)
VVGFDREPHPKQYNRPVRKGQSDIRSRLPYRHHHVTGIITAQGASRIKAGDDVIGAVGVSGAPGGEKDEAWSKAGIDKVADRSNNRSVGSWAGSQKSQAP